MKIIFKGGYVFEVPLSKAHVCFDQKKVLIEWFDVDKNVKPIRSYSSDVWTIPFDLIEDIKL